MATDTPVVEWHLNDLTGATTPDTSGNGFTGTVTNVATRPDGEFDGAAGLLDSATVRNSTVAAPRDAKFQTPSVTLSVWVRNNGAPAHGGYIASYGDRCTQMIGGSYGMTADSQGLDVGVTTDGVHLLHATPAQVLDNGWHNVVMTYDGPGHTE
ncbi:MAG: hypothetical protein QOF76_5240, partial [Solirubrobacteraceae bacterium]|nr:hypothetical protein [Solirubrobacteraceae bacterium]